MTWAWQGWNDICGPFAVNPFKRDLLWAPGEYHVFPGRDGACFVAGGDIHAWFSGIVCFPWIGHFIYRVPINK